MAVAGLSNVIRESPSPASRWWADCGMPSTRASSLLQMWRELEVENVTSRGGRGVRIGRRPVQGGVDEVENDSLGEVDEVESECVVLQSGNEDNKSLTLESMDFTEVERERVRGIFREWRTSGRRDNNSNNDNTISIDSQLNNCSRGQWLGEKECERVRIVREWVEKTTQQRSTCHGRSGRDEPDAEIGDTIERVRDGLPVDHRETTRARTKIRRLCGRQALLDLLMKAERERKSELQDLLEHHRVSDFPHRNRIQSLLKARFLRNIAYIQEERSSSAASELGVLRQKHNVSGLREGFLSSEPDYIVCGSSGSTQSDSSSHNYISRRINDKTQTDGFQEVVLNEFCYNSENSNEETDVSVSYSDDSECDLDEGLHMQDSATVIDERHEVLQNEDTEQLASTIELTETRNDYIQGTSGNLKENGGNDRPRETLTNEGSGQATLLEAHTIPGNIDQLQGTVVEDLNWQNTPLQSEEWQDSVTENGDMDWALLSNDDCTELRDERREGIDVNAHEGSHQWYQVIPENNDIEHSPWQLPHDEWQANTLLEAMDNWSEEASGEEVAPGDRFDVSYFCDDENGKSLELRELLSRRRVSNLLRSDFRFNLDQLLQSYVERQGHTSADITEHEQHIGDLGMDRSESVGNTQVVLRSPQVTPSQNTWDQNLDGANRQQSNSPTRLGIEWEVVNDLRIDMTLLHQRMNCLQKMLEACMDMQLELQRAVRQEVSAALNRPSLLEGSSDEELLVQDESKWDHVKKGICCLCCDSSVDSLLYRCGHMCTCSKCAEKLVQGREKCQCAVHRSLRGITSIHCSDQNKGVRACSSCTASRCELLTKLMDIIQNGME